jgi:hypothetical protein
MKSRESSSQYVNESGHWAKSTTERIGVSTGVSNRREIGLQEEWERT